MVIGFSFLQGTLVLLGKEDFWLTELFGGINYGDLFAAFYVLNTVLSLKNLMVRSFDAMKKKNKDFTSSLLVLSPFAIFIVLINLWYFTSVNHLDIYHMRLFYNSICFTFGYLTSRFSIFIYIYFYLFLFYFFFYFYFYFYF